VGRLLVLWTVASEVLSVVLLSALTGKGADSAELCRRCCCCPVLGSFGCNLDDLCYYAVDVYFSTLLCNLVDLYHCIAESNLMYTSIPHSRVV
jgi:hypothetical protein